MYTKELAYIPQLLPLPVLSLLILGLTEHMVDESTIPLYPSANNLTEDTVLPALPTGGSTVSILKGEAH